MRFTFLRREIGLDALGVQKQLAEDSRIRTAPARLPELALLSLPERASWFKAWTVYLGCACVETDHRLFC